MDSWGLSYTFPEVIGVYSKSGKKRGSEFLQNKPCSETADRI